VGDICAARLSVAPHTLDLSQNLVPNPPLKVSRLPLPTLGGGKILQFALNDVGKGLRKQVSCRASVLRFHLQVEIDHDLLYADVYPTIQTCPM
jgi:hypothetical protein